MNSEVIENLINNEDIENDQIKFAKQGITSTDRSTSPSYTFSMQEFLDNISNSNDIVKVNEYEIIEENLNNDKSKNVNCNTYYSNDIFLLSNNTVNQDKKKTKEERKKEREKKKENDQFKKYQIEQEANHKAIAKSKCGRWVKFNIKIGEGSYKFVYRGYDSIDAKNIAWCEFKSVHADTKEKRSVVFKETEIMLQMNHPHIVSCFDVLNEWQILEEHQTLDVKGIVIIQELMEEGTLKNIIKKNFNEGKCILKFPLITLWWHQILDALRYMHNSLNLSIIHRDLKADNCFLYGQTDDNFLNLKVGDFGLATHVKTQERKSMLGTLGFMAPEIYEEKYDESVDIYAFGMLMLEVMTNRTPYDECGTLVQIAAKTLTGEDPKGLEMVEDKWLREMISSCIHPMACYRPTAEELYFHPIFQCKNLNVEVELNNDKLSSKNEVIDQFISNIANCKKMNLRLRFRDKRMLQQVGLDDGESLEFDLDIYKAIDEDIPELIQNLRLEYEDKLSKVYDNPKILDKSTVSANLDKLFLSLELQMKCLVKHLLGRRWKDIMNSLVTQHATKNGDEEHGVGDDQDKDLNRFTMISEYKKMWAQAKRLLDKEIQVYRETSVTESQTTMTTHDIDIKSNPNELIIKLTDETLRNLNLSPENPELLQKRSSTRRQFQVVTSTTNSDIAMDAHDCPKECIQSICSNFNLKSMDTLDQVADISDILSKKHISYNIRIKCLENCGHNVNVTFVIEIPVLSKQDGGKWVLSFKCAINEFSNLDSFELNSSGIFIDKVDNEVNMVLQETVQDILKLIRLDQNLVLIDENYVFFPKKENFILSDLYPKAIEKIRFEHNKLAASSEVIQIQTGESFKDVIMPDTTKPSVTCNQPAIIPNSNLHRTSSSEFINEKIKEYVESLFDHDNAVLLVRKTENDDTQFIKAHNIPLGSAIVINRDMIIKNIKKTTIISPTFEPTGGNVFMRELDKTDLFMDKTINILSLLLEKIEELSSRDVNQKIVDVINFKVLFETNAKLTEQNTLQISSNLNTEKHIGKQKIIEQVLKQKQEIEILQMQQSQFLALLENSSKIKSSTDFQDLINQQPVHNKIYLNQLNNKTFNQENNYLYTYPQQNQVILNSTDPRLLMSNNGLQPNNFVIADTVEYPNNTTKDSSFRTQISGLKDTTCENQTIHKVEPTATINMNRIFPELNYQIDRMDQFDNNIRQIPFHGNEQISEELQTTMAAQAMLKNLDPVLLNQLYPQSYPFYYQVPYAGYSPRSVPSFYDEPKPIVVSGKTPLLYHPKDTAVIIKDGIFNRVMPEDIILTNEAIYDTQVHNDSISFSSLMSNEAIKSVYQDNFQNQKFPDR